MNITPQPPGLAKKMALETGTPIENPQDVARASPDEKEHLDLAPTSEQAKEDVDMGDGEDSETGDEAASGDEEELQSAGYENKTDQRSGGEEGLQGAGEKEKIDVMTLSSKSDEEVHSGQRQESSDSNGSVDSDDSSDLDFKEEREQNGCREQARRNTDLPESSRASSHSTDCYSSTGLGALDVLIAEIRPYDWISARVLEGESIFRSE